MAELTVFAAIRSASMKQKSHSLVPIRSSGLFGFLHEPFAGAWQKNVVVDDRESLLAFSAVYACVNRISSDIAKLRIRLVRQVSGIWSEVAEQSPFWPVLRKPNRYQNRIQFFTAWMIAKLLYGNAYILKERDARGIVTALYPLDSRRVTPLVGSDGSVWYQIGMDELAGLGNQITVPASEIIHDRCMTLFHTLIGVSPIYACGSSGTQGTRIQANSAKFFENMSRPSGMLTAPAEISDPTAARMKAEFEKNYGGGNIGRLFVAGDGLKYEPMTIPAEDAQLIQQLEWTVADVARAFFGIPLYKINAGPLPSNNNVAALDKQYYDGVLQFLIESIELCLDEGLGLDQVPGQTLGTEFDLAGLLRMDASTRAEVLAKLAGAGLLSPDEARAQENYGPVTGGSTPYLQQQNYSLAALAKRDAREDPFASAKPAPSVAAPAISLPADDADEDAMDDEDIKSVAAALLMKCFSETLEHA